MKAARSLAGWFPIASKEARTTFLSLRFLILMLLVALAVLAGTYAVAPGVTIPGGEKVAYGFTYWPDLNRSRPAMAMYATSPTGEPLSGVEVHLAEQATSGLQVLDVNRTVAGWARFESLSNRFPNRTLLLLLPNDPRGIYAQAVTSSNWSNTSVEYTGLLTARFASLGVTNRQVLSLVFLDSHGNPTVGGDVYVWKPGVSIGPDPGQVIPPGGWTPYHNGTTGADGYYMKTDPLAPGEYVVRAEKGSLNDTELVSFFAGPADPLSRGPDGVLAFVGVTFLPLLLPITALVFGFDAIARERSEGSLDLLLSKPVGRLGVALGKLIGAFVSIAVPVTVILSGSALLIWLQTGFAPSAAFVGSLVGASIFLVLGYALVYLTISASMKNSGTALLVSVFFFLVFAIFWGLVSIVVAGLFGVPGSAAWYEALVTSTLLTPTGVYQQLLILSLPALVGGFYGPIGGTGAQLPFVWVAVAALGWVAAPLALFLWTANYRLGES